MLRHLFDVFSLHFKAQYSTSLYSHLGSVLASTAPAQTDGIHPYIRSERKREEMQKNKKIDEITKSLKNVKESPTGRRKHRGRVGGRRKRRLYNYTSCTDQYCMYNRKMKSVLFLSHSRTHILRRDT